MLAIADSKSVYKWTWKVLVGVDQLPLGAVYMEDLKGSGFDAVFCSACLIKGQTFNLIDRIKLIRGQLSSQLHR